jgi:peptidoglycan/LPS O-acetylase OafA/YrhL
LRGRKLFWIFWIVSLLPAASAVACAGYLNRALQFHEVDRPGALRYWAVMEGVSFGLAIPRLWARLACMFLVLALILVAGWSFGLFYIPTLGLAVAAVLIQIESDGKWHRANRA